MTCEPCLHVVGVEDGIFCRSFQAISAQHPDISVADQQNACASKWGTAHSSISFGNVQFSAGGLGMSWQEGGQMILHTNGPHAGSTATMRYGKGFVQVQVTNVSTNQSGCSEANLGIHVGAVHVYLTTMSVDDGGNVFHSLLIDTIGAGIGDHDASKVFAVLDGFFIEVLYVDVAIFQGFYNNYFHASHHC